MNEQALKARLKQIAKSNNRSFNDVWSQLILERILVRIGKSKYYDQLIFKGGLLLAHYVEIGRETKDIDLLATNFEISRQSIEHTFQEITSLQLPDKFEFTFSSIESLEQPHMNYPGFRVKLTVALGKMRDKIQLDIGVGDIVQPKVESLSLYHYQGKPIYEGSVSLMVYPIETIFAEKIETVISKGSINSRMKDFHDLIILCRINDLIKVDQLKESLTNTFTNRNTTLSIPVNFSDIEIKKLQPMWSAHLRTLGPTAKELDLPKNMADLIEELNNWLSRCKLVV